MEDYPDYLPIVLPYLTQSNTIRLNPTTGGEGEKKTKNENDKKEKRKKERKKHPETRNTNHILAEPHGRGGTARTFRGVHQLIESIIDYHLFIHSFSYHTIGHNGVQ